MKSFKKNIFFREWVILAFISCGIVSVMFTSFYSSYRARAVLRQKKIHVEPEKIVITVTGAVKKPGEYAIKSGGCLRKILKTAKIKREANLDELFLNQPLRESQTIEVPAREFFEIKVEGEVLEPGVYQVDIHARFCDLKKILKLSKRADLKVFKSRRLLKHGEKIYIPVDEEKK